MKTIGWGKPDIYIRKTSEQYFTKLPNPAEDTTKLETTKGDKMEAKDEGGELAAVKHKKATYILSYGIRVAAETIQPIAHVDGVVEDEYVVVVVPENKKAPGIYIEHSEVSVDDSFASAEGGIITYEHAVLAATTGKSVKHGIMTVTESGGNISISANGQDFDSSTSLNGSAPAQNGGSSPS